MADEHPSGDPGMIEQHKRIQREGDKDLAGTGTKVPRPQEEDTERQQTTTESNNSGLRQGGGGSFVGP